MDHNFRKQLQRSFEKRGGRFGIAPDASPQTVPMLLEGLLECPECRAVVLEACNSDDRKNVDIDDVIRDLAQSRHH
jgi:hypothetical protein